MTSIPFHAEHSLPVARDIAYRALSSPDALARWFAENVRGDVAVGAELSLVGRGVLGGDAKLAITAVTPNESIAFEWTLLGVPTKVRWSLADHEGKCKLAIDHDIADADALPFANPRHAIDDLWRLHAGNLSAHLGGEDAVLVDFGAREQAVRVSIEIAAPPEKVFRALMEPELMNRWLHGTAEVDVAARSYSYGWSYDIEDRKVAGGPTKILELVENERLVTDWPDWRGDPDKPPTRVTWLLEPLDAGARTRVTIVHDGFAHAVDRSDYQQGWGYFANGLKTVAEAPPERT